MSVTLGLMFRGLLCLNSTKIVVEEDNITKNESITRHLISFRLGSILFHLGNYLRKKSPYHLQECLSSHIDVYSCPFSVSECLDQISAKMWKV